jgi:hypothetical protein
LAKKELPQEIEEFITDFDFDKLSSFLMDVIPLVELYAVEEDNDWVLKEVGPEDTDNVRIVRTVYLISKMSERHSGILAKIRAKYARLWEKIEKNAVEKKI